MVITMTIILPNVKNVPLDVELVLIMETNVLLAQSILGEFIIREQIFVIVHKAFSLMVRSIAKVNTYFNKPILKDALTAA